MANTVVNLEDRKRSLGVREKKKWAQPRGLGDSNIQTLEKYMEKPGKINLKSG